MTRSLNIGNVVLVAVAFFPGARAIERPIDVANSSVRIHVRKAGLFSRADAEHLANLRLFKAAWEKASLLTELSLSWLAR